MPRPPRNQGPASPPGGRSGAPPSRHGGRGAGGDREPGTGEQRARGPRRRRAGARKDRLVQARVPRELEETLKHEARRRRLTVSHLVRTVLEDAFLLVDDLVQDVDRIVGDSVTLARRLGRARRTGNRPEAGAGTGPSEEARGVPPDAGLDEVEAWTPVVLNRAVCCDSCEARLARGESAYAGIGARTPSRRAWLCERCVKALR